MNTKKYEGGDPTTGGKGNGKGGKGNFDLVEKTNSGLEGGGGKKQLRQSSHRIEKRDRSRPKCIGGGKALLFKRSNYTKRERRGKKKD